MSAASSTASRRSAAFMRVVVISGTLGRLVMTHKFVKSLRDPVLLGLGEPLMQRQGERAFERGVGAREGALVAVRAEAVERVGAGRALDPLAPGPAHPPVAGSDLDHFPLPAVPATALGARQRVLQVREP